MLVECVNRHRRRRHEYFDFVVISSAQTAICILAEHASHTDNSSKKKKKKRLYFCLWFTSKKIPKNKKTQQLRLICTETKRSDKKLEAAFSSAALPQRNIESGYCLKRQAFSLSSFFSSDVQSHPSMARGQGILPWTSILRRWEHCLHAWKKAMCLHRCLELLAHMSSCSEPHHHLLCHGLHTFCISLPFDTEMKEAGGGGAHSLAFAASEDKRYASPRSRLNILESD